MASNVTPASCQRTTRCSRIPTVGWVKAAVHVRKVLLVLREPFLLGARMLPR